MPTLYDNYQLANSNGVRQYQGSAMPEMIKVADVMQQRYDASELGMEGLQTMMNNAKVLSKDQPLFNQVYDGYQKQLKDWSQRPDLENVTKDVAKSGRAFANEYKAFADNVGRAQAYQKDLDEKVDKKLISRNTADQLLQMSYDQYGGLKKDENGRYSGQFSGAGSANEIDPLAFTNKALEQFAASKNGWVRKAANGDYFLETGHSTEQITPDQIRNVLKAAMDSDNEFKSDLHQRMSLAQWSARRGKLDDIKDSPDMLKDAKEYMDKGYTESQAVAAAHANHVGNSFVNDIYAMGMKKAFKSEEDIRKEDGLTVQGQKKANEKDEPFFLMPSDDFRLAEKDKDLGTITEKANAADANIKDIIGKIDSGKYTGDELSDLKRQLITAKANKISYQAIVDGAQEDAARQMGYTSYAAYKKEQLQPQKLEQKYLSALPSSMANGMTLRNAAGDAIPAKRGFIIDAVREGRVAVKQDAWGETVAITGPDGKQYTVDNTIAAQGLKQMVNGTGWSIFGGRQHFRGDDDFTTRVKNNIKTNAENYAIKPMETPLTEGEGKQLTKTILGDPSSVNFYKKGSSDPTKDIPADFEISSIKVIKDGGKTWLTGYKKDPKTGKPTGDTYNIEVTPGSNVADVIGKRLLMPTGDPKKINQDPSMRAAGAVLLGGDMSGSLGRLANNEKMPITTSSGTILGYVQRKAYATSPGADSRFLIFDEKGNDISQSIPEDFRKDAGKLATWIEDAQLKEERKEIGKND